MKKKLMLFVVIVLLFSMAINAETISTKIEVILNSVNLTVNGEKVEADTIIYNGTTYVPLRAVAEMLNLDVIWDADTKTAVINNRDNDVAETKLDTDSEDKQDTGSEAKQDTSSETSDNEILKCTDFSINNPANIGDLVFNVIVDYSEVTGYVYTSIGDDIIRGKEANEIVKEWNSFNDEPGSDKEYIIVPVFVKYEAKEGYMNTPLDLFSDIKYEIFNGENFAKYPQEVISLPNEVELREMEVYHNGYVAGVLVFMIDKDDQYPILRIDCGSEDYVTWHKLY